MSNCIIVNIVVTEIIEGKEYCAACSLDTIKVKIRNAPFSISTGSSSSALVSVLVRKLVVICSGRIEPSLDLTMALDRDGDLLLGSLLVSGCSETARARLPDLDTDLGDWEGASSWVAERVRSGWRLLRPEVLTMIILHFTKLPKLKSYMDCLFITRLIIRRVTWGDDWLTLEWDSMIYWS